jgi:hypothetical protein
VDLRVILVSVDQLVETKVILEPKVILALVLRVILV